MATAAIIGGGLILGGIASGIGASKQADAQATAAENVLSSAQSFQDTQQGYADQFTGNALTAQNTQLALLGQSDDTSGVDSLLNSPLVQALNEQNSASIASQAASSGVSGGNLLSALQTSNQANIMSAGFNGLSSITNSGVSAGLGYTGQAANALSIGSGAQTNLGEANGASAATPWLTGANILNQGTELATFGASGGFKKGLL